MGREVEVAFLYDMQLRLHCNWKDQLSAFPQSKRESNPIGSEIGRRKGSLGVSVRVG